LLEQEAIVTRYKLTLKDVFEGIAGMGLIVSTFALSPFLQSWYRRWGATDAEVKGELPGDDLVPHFQSVATRAVTIRAPASRVWPLLLQIGLRRGGWYSYDLLEAMAGAADFVGGHSAGRIITELQDLKIGDKIWMHDRILPLTVVALEPEKALVFLTRVNIQTKSYFELGDKMPEQYVNSGWVFFLDCPDKKTTRFIVRSRLDYTPGILNKIAWRVFTDPISFVMERKMLLNIKRIAEAPE
jgi:hypothetical protein